MAITASTVISVDSKSSRPDELSKAFGSMSLSRPSGEEDDPTKGPASIDLTEVKLVSGLETAYKNLMDILIYPLYYREIVKQLNVHPPKGMHFKKSL